MCTVDMAPSFYRCVVQPDKTSVSSLSQGDRGFRGEKGKKGERGEPGEAGASGPLVLDFVFTVIKVEISHHVSS